MPLAENASHKERLQIEKFNERWSWDMDFVFGWMGGCTHEPGEGWHFGGGGGLPLDSQWVFGGFVVIILLQMPWQREGAVTLWFDAWLKAAWYDDMARTLDN